MDNTRKACMSIKSIIDDDTQLPPSPPQSYKSQSSSPSPNLDYLPSPVESRRNIYHMPMSLEERRYRNKLASAKYRAKKQANIKSMSNKVSQLVTNNTTLQSELNKVKQENKVLRAILSSYQQKNNDSTCPSSYHHHYQQTYLPQPTSFY